uniref:bifunctional diguanylate cyclase/phosphodiesterase n=1 Tax=Actinotalea sp. TaxID=1872145 RepID=UPI0035670FA6
AAVLMGRATRMGPDELAPIWPAAGVGVLWIVRSAARRQVHVAGPLLAVLAGVLNVATGVRYDVGVALGIANGAQAIAFCWAMYAIQRRLGRAPLRVRGPADLIAAAVAAVAATALGGLVAGVAMHLAEDASLESVLTQWVARNAIGILVVGAPLLVLTDPRRARVQHARPVRTIETVAVLLAAAGVHVAFFGFMDAPATAFLLLPIGIVVAERYGADIGGLYTLVSGAVVVWFTLRGLGPLAVPDVNESALLAQALVGVSSLVTLSLALRNEESRAAHQRAELAQRGAVRQAGLLHTIVETTPHAIIVYGSNGGVLHSNAAALRLLDDPLDELWAARYDELDATGAAHPLTRSPIRAALGGDGPAEIDLVERVDAGAPARFLSVSVAQVPTHADDSASGGAILTARDVTRTRAAAQEIREARDRLSSLMDAATMQIIVGADSAGLITLFNAGAAAILGHAPQDMIGTPLLDLWDPDELAAVGYGLPLPDGTSLLDLAQQWHGTPKRWTLRRADGTRLVAEMTISPTSDGTGVMCVAQDISEHVAAETRLIDSEQRFRLAFDTAPITMLILDATAGSQSILESNATASTFTGLPTTGLRQRTLHDLVHPEDRGRCRRWITRLLRDPDSQERAEMRFEDASGATRWGIASAALVRSTDPAGQQTSYVLCIVEDVTARRRAESALLRQSLHDPLTGLPNRALLIDRLAEATATGSVAGLLFCDLDGFKEVNDTFGHPAGDAALKAIAGRLVTRIRPIDTLARIGGDEFAVVYPGISTLTELENVARRLMEAVELPVTEDAVDSFPVGMSIGMVLVTPGTGAEVALACADTAMYEAKRAGNNSIRAYRESGRSDPPITLLRELRIALRDEQFRLFAQPIVEMATGEVRAAEVLLRWEHPTRGLIAPAEFLPALEASTLMLPVGRWVLREACRAGASWFRSHGPDAPEVHVNIAAVQLEQPDFVEDVLAELESSGLPPTKLVLEITETKMPRLDGLDLLGLDDLRRRGVRLAMDDVGTGYAGLVQFTELPLDLVKLDQRFVSQLGVDPRCDAVMRTVLGLSSALGLDAVAEGVESEHQAAILSAAGYTKAQGYLFGRPAPITLTPPSAQAALGADAVA